MTIQASDERITVRVRDNNGWRHGTIYVNAARPRGRKRVTLHIGRLSIQLSAARALELSNEIVDALEEVTR